MENGVRRFLVRDDHILHSKIVQSVQDLNATFRRKNGKDFIGYVTNQVQTGGPLGFVVIHWTLEQNTVSDSDMLGIYLEESDRIWEEVRQMRVRLGLPENAGIILCVGELLPNKNQKMAIGVVEKLVLKDERYVYILLLIAGNGPEKENLEKEIADRDMQKHVKLLG